MNMTGFECYKTYLALKNHFTSDSYDYFKYQGKTSAKEDTFKTRRDRYFFESMSRKRTDQEIIEYFLSNFVYSTDPKKLWIREIIRNGEGNFVSWKKRRESMTYSFTNDLDIILEDDLDKAIKSSGSQHSPMLRKYLAGRVSLETLIILDKILNFKQDYDNILTDPVWTTVSKKMSKYEPFVSVDVSKFVKIVRRKVT
jgi:hypothetical protein